MIGQTYESEMSTSRDVVTGVEITQLTNHRAHSHHLYFTNPGWYDSGRRMLLVSDRGNATNLYSIELATGRITQITDFSPAQRLGNVCVNPTRAEAVLWIDRTLLAIDLQTLAQRVLYEAPAGWMPQMVNVTADGAMACTAISQQFSSPRAGNYVGYREHFLARPWSRLLRIPVSGGEATVLLERQAWITHVNTSPTRANLLTFCHEGPWHEVDQRIWGYDLSTGKDWKIRPQGPGDAVGHEYWFDDGVTIGYHGDAPGGLMFGAIQYDNSDRIEVPFPHDSRHFYSQGMDLIVGDGRNEFPYLLLWKYESSARRYAGPYVLAWHRSSSHVQPTHVHPRITPDGKAVVFTSDSSGYGSVYLAEMPPLESLMTFDQLQRSPKKPWVPFEWVKERMRG